MSPLSDSQSTKPVKPRKLRAACDACHRSKTRCSGGNPCTRCREYLSSCSYSYSVRCGKPKGSRCRKTLEREQRVAAAAAANRDHLHIHNHSRTQSQSHAAEPVNPPPPDPVARTEELLPGQPASNAPSPRDDSSLCFSDDVLRSPAEVERTQADTTISDTITAVADPLSFGDLDASDNTGFPLNWMLPDLSVDALEALSLPSSNPNDLANALFVPGTWGTHGLETTTTTETQNPLLPRDPCKCLLALTTLTTSRDITAPTVRQCDATLVFVRNFSRAFCAFYQCAYCPKDAGSISLAVTTLQLATSALETTMRHHVRCSVRVDGGAIKPTVFDPDDVCSSFAGAGLLLPAGGGNATPLPFQLGIYHTSGEDDEEQSQIMSVLIRSAVRRLLGVCWPVWDLLRSIPGSCDRSGGFESSKLSSLSLDNLLEFSSAEVAQLRRTLVQLQSRLCNLL
nr:transcription factor Zn2Cys6 [Aspergillus cejpii]